jgi:peroxiredoxin
MRHGVPNVFSDEDLSRLKAPALLLMGEHDRHYSIGRVEQRARRTVPGIRVEVIAGGGHLFPLDRSEETNARILSFLQ